MDSAEDAGVRTDAGGDGEFSAEVRGPGGLVVGAIPGSSFGMDAAVVGAGVGWGLGDELDRRPEAKVNGADRGRSKGGNHVEKQKRSRVTSVPQQYFCGPNESKI